MSTLIGTLFMLGGVGRAPYIWKKGDNKMGLKQAIDELEQALQIAIMAAGKEDNFHASLALDDLRCDLEDIYEDYINESLGSN